MKLRIPWFTLPMLLLMLFSTFHSIDHGAGGRHGGPGSTRHVHARTAFHMRA